MGAYGQWLRLARLNELGEEPNYVCRRIECGLSTTDLETVIRHENDIDVVKGGLAKLLRHSGRDAKKGSDQAGLTVGQLKGGLRSHPGLPVLSDSWQLNEAFKSMVQDVHLETGIVIAVGKAIYGYDDRALPIPLSDDWRVWLKAYAPEPPAPEDVKHAVRQALAAGGQQGVQAQAIVTDVRGRLQVERQEVLRALSELTNDREAVLEQGETRFPDDGQMASDSILDVARAWLVDHAPPDDRAARRRLMQLLRDAQPEAIPLGDLKQQLAMEGIDMGAIQRGLQRLLQRGEAIAEVTGEGAPYTTHLGDLSLLGDEALIGLPGQDGPPPPPPTWVPFDLPLGPYRLLDQLLGDLRARLREEARIRTVAFVVTPTEPGADPLFQLAKELAEAVPVTIRHELCCEFMLPTNKDGALSITQTLLEGLRETGGILVSVRVSGDVPY